MQAAFLSGDGFDNQAVAGPFGSQPTGVLFSDTTYTLRVILRGGGEEIHTVLVTVIPNPIPPPAPTQPEPGMLENSYYVVNRPVELKWMAVPDPCGIKEYYVELQYCNYISYSDDWNCTPWKTYTTSDTSRDVSDDLSTFSQSRVRWRVQAIDNAGNQGIASPWLYFHHHP